jgi:hypothetical protein
MPAEEGAQVRSNTLSNASSKHDRAHLAARAGLAEGAPLDPPRSVHDCLALCALLGELARLGEQRGEEGARAVQTRERQCLPWRSRVQVHELGVAFALDLSGSATITAFPSSL